MSDEKTSKTPKRGEPLPEDSPVGETISGKTWRVPPGYLNRDMIKEKFTISDFEFRSLTKRRILKKAVDAQGRPRRDSVGNYLFEEAHVMKRFETVGSAHVRPIKMLGTEHPTQKINYALDEAERVFAHLEKGTSLAAIVLKEKLHPSVVWTIAKDYTALNECALITAKWMERIRTLPLMLEMPMTGESLFEELSRLTAPNMCSYCHQGKQCGLCAGCAMSAAKKKLASGDD